MLAMFELTLKNIRQKLIDANLSAVFVSSVANITYLTGYANFSKDEREAYLLIGKDFGYLITDGRYTEAVKKQVMHLSIFDRGQGRSTKELFKKHKEIKTLGIEEDNLTVQEFKFIKRHFNKTKHFQVSKIRQIKNPDEIIKIQKACEIGDQAFEFIVKEIKAGVTEKQILGLIEKFIKDRGMEMSFSTIVAFGANSSIPHHQTGDKQLTIEDKMILLDFGVKYENYCSDMTRTVFLGSPSEKQIKIYKTVLEAQQKAVKFLNKSIKSGKQIKASQVDKIARDYIIKNGYPSIPHSLGHGIGLEVHENPHLSSKSKEELTQGMVFSIEPGIYIPGFGGVRIEDLYVFEKTGLKQITKSPKEQIII